MARSGLEGARAARWLPPVMDTKDAGGRPNNLTFFPFYCHLVPGNPRRDTWCPVLSIDLPPLRVASLNATCSSDTANVFHSSTQYTPQAYAVTKCKDSLLYNPTLSLSILSQLPTPTLLWPGACTGAVDDWI